MHIKLGRYNQLEIVKEVDFGVYLDGGDDGEILLPTRYVPKDCNVGDLLNVFIYLDEQERLIATTLTPLVQVGEFACLTVSWVNQHGAFLDWGLMKDIFVPFREQKTKMQRGQRYVVYAYIDEESYRIAASAKVEHFLSKEMPPYRIGDRIHGLVWQTTDLGFKVIVDNRYSGLLYRTEVFEPLPIGTEVEAYVKQVREDGKIDLALHRKEEMEGVNDFSKRLLQYIRQQGGYITLHDKSLPEEIYATFGISKKVFKKAVGDLYKKRLITLEEKGIRLAK